MNNLTTNEYEKIVLSSIPLIDVRAPVEYSKGAFENAVNLPLMNDEERHAVGVCYQKKGNEEALELGYKLVSGEIKEQRVNAWINQINNHPDSLIYCFRGGQRSQIAQQWIKQATGQKIVRLAEGYKGFRTFLMNELNPEKIISRPLILGGFTGSGKTVLLNQLQNSIDLEGLANHRGSSFGNRETPQPTQIDFENNLAYSLIRHRNDRYQYLLIEDEGRNVGNCFLPKTLVQFFDGCDMVVLEIPLKERVKAIFNEYVTQAQTSSFERFGIEEGLSRWAETISNNLAGIRKRLGGERHQRIEKELTAALIRQRTLGDKELHEKWIESLLLDYYDPMYLYQLQQASSRIVFKGDRTEVKEYLSEKSILRNI